MSRGKSQVIRCFVKKFYILILKNLKTLKKLGKSIFGIGIFFAVLIRGKNID